MKRRAVLVNSYGWPTTFVSEKNPRETVQSVHEAFRFPSLKDARDAKRALGIGRHYIARTLPEWL